MTFARGAKVRPPVDPPITLEEAAFVMCDIAKKNGMDTPEKFLRYMATSWLIYGRASPSQTPGEHS